MNKSKVSSYPPSSERSATVTVETDNDHQRRWFVIRLSSLEHIWCNSPLNTFIAKTIYVNIFILNEMRKRCYYMNENKFEACLVECVNDYFMFIIRMNQEKRKIDYKCIINVQYCVGSSCVCILENFIKLMTQCRISNEQFVFGWNTWTQVSPALNNIVITNVPNSNSSLKHERWILC